VKRREVGEGAEEGTVMGGWEVGMRPKSWGRAGVVAISGTV
jgi:hypothetical protein